MDTHLTETQIHRLFSSATSLRDYLLVRTKYETGCTISELVTLKRKDVTKNSVQIAGRTSVVSAELAKKLRDVKTEYVFTSRQNGQMSQKRAEQLIKQQLRAIGVDATPHILRYTHIVHAAQKGISAKDIRKQTGLGSLRVAQIIAEHAHTTAPVQKTTKVKTRTEQLVRLVQETGVRLADVVKAHKTDLTDTGIHLGGQHHALSKELREALSTHAEHLFASRQDGHITTRRAAQLIKEYYSAAATPQTLRNAAVIYKHQDQQPVHLIASRTQRKTDQTKHIITQHHTATRTYAGGLL